MTKQRTVAKPLQNGGSAGTLSDVTTHWLTIGELPPELITGHKLIDFEHRFLVGAIADLRKVCVLPEKPKDCMACQQTQQRSCEAGLISLLGDVFAFILDHFKTEETIMRDSLLLMVDRDVCEAHMEDHAAISMAVQEIVSALDSQYIVVRIRELDGLLTRWLTNHIAMHDMLLSRWISREDSLFKGA